MEENIVQLILWLVLFASNVHFFSFFSLFKRGNKLDFWLKLLKTSGQWMQLFLRDNFCGVSNRRNDGKRCYDKTNPQYLEKEWPILLNGLDSSPQLQTFFIKTLNVTKRSWCVSLFKQQTQRQCSFCLRCKTKDSIELTQKHCFPFKRITSAAFRESLSEFTWMKVQKWICNWKAVCFVLTYIKVCAEVGRLDLN